MTLFEVVYGKNPPSILSYIIDVSKVQAFGQTLTVREVILRTFKENLLMDQNHMRKHVYQGLSECQFVEGDQVFL
jgi:hypothetical protein